MYQTKSLPFVGRASQVTGAGREMDDRAAIPYSLLRFDLSASDIAVGHLCQSPRVCSKSQYREESDRHWEEGQDMSLLDFKTIQYKPQGYAIVDEEQPGSK